MEWYQQSGSDLRRAETQSEITARTDTVFFYGAAETPPLTYEILVKKNSSNTYIKCTTFAKHFLCTLRIDKIEHIFDNKSDSSMC